RFDSRRVYSENEVNAVLKAANAFGDHVTLRRELVDHRLLARTRDGSEYRKLPARPDSEARALLTAWRARRRGPSAVHVARGRARRSLGGCGAAPARGRGRGPGAAGSPGEPGGSAGGCRTPLRRATAVLPARTPRRPSPSRSIPAWTGSRDRERR